MARVKIGTKTKQMKAKVSIGTCGFDQNVVVSFDRSTEYGRV